MATIGRIPMFLLFYVITFFSIKLTHQVDGVVKRVVRVDNFFVDGRNPLNIDKCPENSRFYYLQAYGVCKADANNITDDTKVWFPPEHAQPDKRSGQDTDENNKESANPVFRAYYKYCEPFFNEKKKCTLSINKAEEGDDRFKTEDGLTCAFQGKSIFNGVFFCIRIPYASYPSIPQLNIILVNCLYIVLETEGSAVKDGEEVTLVGFRGVPLEPVCPEDRKIKTITAFTYGPKLTNKGFVESFFGEARDKCDGNENCSLDFEDTGRFLKYRIYTYKCVE